MDSNINNTPKDALVQESASMGYQARKYVDRSDR